MNDQRVKRFWRDLSEAATVKSVVDRYKNQVGWARARTLERYALVYRLFNKGETVEEVISKASWSTNRVAKLRTLWWNSFGSDADDSVHHVSPELSEKSYSDSVLEDTVAPYDRVERLSGTENHVRELVDDRPLAGLRIAKETHLNELMQYGSRLRERLAVVPCLNVDPQVGRVKAVWHGSRFDELYQDEVDSSYVKQWGHGFQRRGRTGPFCSYRSHLQDHNCWAALDDFERGLFQYCHTERELLFEIRRIVTTIEEFSGTQPEAACRDLQKRILWGASDYFDSRGSDAQMFIAFRLYWTKEYDDWGQVDPRERNNLEPPEFEPEQDILMSEGGLPARLHRAVLNDPTATKRMQAWTNAKDGIVRASLKWWRATMDESALRAAITKGSCENCPA